MEGMGEIVCSLIVFVWCGCDIVMCVLDYLLKF